jgi:hypothetical protein
VSHEIQDDRGPVLVTVEYRIDSAKRRPFLQRSTASAASAVATLRPPRQFRPFGWVGRPTQWASRLTYRGICA